MSAIIPSPNIWYFPSAFGDIRLEQAEGSGETRVIWFNLTPREAEALEGLRKASQHWRRKWCSGEAWDKLEGREAFRVGDRTEHHVILKADLGKVGPILNKVLNPDRRTLHVMRIGQGKIEEVREDMFSTPEDESRHRMAALKESEAERERYKKDQEEKERKLKEESSPHRRDDGETAIEVAKPKKPSKPAKVATVKEPVRGCPPPDFASIARRATRVLKAFLTPEQVRDFNQYNRFIVRGADTGHQYMLTSRNATTELGKYGGRTVFDLNEGRAMCVHDWDVPAEEELLSLAMLLQLPKRESWVRHLPDNHLRHRHT